MLFRWGSWWVVLGMFCLPACRTMQVRSGPADRHGRVYYLDGAGGPGLLGDLSKRVEKGLVSAGYRGSFCSYRWHTGLGVAVDQAVSVGYKRHKAAALAQSIRRYRSQHPHQPVNLIGLSAGTAVTIFALEALPDSFAVDNVVLLGSSLSSDYDIAGALRHVRNRMYVVTSDRDAVLKFLVPLSGTADRKYCGLCSAGLRGFRLPEEADGTARGRALYRKLETIPWRPQFREAGNRGGHTGGVEPRFVHDYIAPLLLHKTARLVQADPPPIPIADSALIGIKGSRAAPGAGAGR